MIDADRQNAALDEVERLIALAHSSDGEELPADPKEAAFIKTIYESEKKLQGRMAGLMPALAGEVYVTEAGEVVRPSVAIAQIETKRYDSPAFAEQLRNNPSPQQRRELSAEQAAGYLRTSVTTATRIAHLGRYTKAIYRSY